LVVYQKNQQKEETQVKHNTNHTGIQSALINDREFLKEVAGRFLQSLIDNEFIEHIGAGRYERSEERKGLRNGHYERQLKTRVGCIELFIPRDREGVFRTELFERYQRSEKALVIALAEMYFKGVSTRKVSGIVEELCGHSVSKSHISDLSKELDEEFEKWRMRPLTETYAYVLFDAIYQKVREGGRVESCATFIGVGITEAGHREVLGCYVAKSEHKAEWKGFLRSLKERGLKSPMMVISDDHEGLRQAIVEELTGALWQRCQVHYMRNYAGKLGQKCKLEMIPLLREVLHAESLELALAAKEKLIDRLLESGQKAVAEWVEETVDDTLNVLNLPERHRKKIRSTNMLERVNEEIRRRTRVIRIFPCRASCTRLITSICQEISENWEGRRYINFEEE
jgi:putative transposase